jgi:hypothetical protein
MMSLTKINYYCDELEVSVEGELVVLLAGHDAHLLVLAHPLLEEVSLPLQGDGVHEVKRVRHIVHLRRNKICKYRNFYVR